ncbi:Alpha-protein kinase 1 [Diplonema papillatum]|nr:Alpha-protein kinase 1 [Diplonema papillatum]KAJ9466980.1 Alpha-protein kinase 1 [Diplonema papillatum]
MASPRSSRSQVLRGTRYHYDCSSGKWVTSSIRVEMRGVIGKGGMRVAYEAVEDDIPVVVKFSTIYKEPSAQKEACRRDARAQGVAEYYASLFSKKPSREKISFVSSDAVKFDDGRWANIEPKLHGNYEKHNNNLGAVITTNPTAQAFSHFTWEESFHSLLICDIQGVGGMFTDPQIHSSSDSRGERFGDGDIGDKGIRAFLTSHHCNSVCRSVGLPENSKYRPGAGGAQGGLQGAGAGGLMQQLGGLGMLGGLEQQFRQMQVQGMRGQAGGGEGGRHEGDEAEHERAREQAELRHALRENLEANKRHEQRLIERAVQSSLEAQQQQQPRKSQASRRQVDEDAQLAYALHASLSSNTGRPPAHLRPAAGIRSGR